MKKFVVQLVINLIIYQIVLKIIFSLTDLTDHMSIVFVKKADETWMTDGMRAWEIIPFRRLLTMDT
jgi:hypothetical protein